ncbi:ATP-binding cassette domain-containing protein [Pseudomonadota bacterium]
MADKDVPPLLEINKVSKRFDDHQALSGVDLKIHRGEIVTLIGPNGSGKTTLVRIALGLLRPDGGRVKRLKNLKIGYVPQLIHIDATLPLRVSRFLTIGRRHRQMLVPLSRVTEEVGIAGLLDKQLNNLSGGELRRVLLGRALLQNPDFLVLDEPSAGVDVSGQSELYKLIRDIRDHHNCGILLVSHDLHFVMAATDRVVCLNHHICCDGQPEVVSRHPEYLSLFGPQTNLAIYAHHHNHSHELSGEVHPEPDSD